nr:hypothetical protein [Tanacetum cinerariifolium]
MSCPAEEFALLILLSATITLFNKVEDPDLRIFNKWYQSLVRSFDLQKNNIQALQKKNKTQVQQNLHRGLNQVQRMKYLTTLYAQKIELETLKQEKDVVDGKLARLLKSLKDLESLIESQRSDKIKDGVGYNAVPPPAADLYLSLKKDLSWTGLPEFADNTVTDYSRPAPTVEYLENLIESQRSDKIKDGEGYNAVPPPAADLYLSPKKDLSWTESTSEDGQNRISFASENGEPTDSILSKPAFKFVKAVDRPAERPTTNKAETVKKPPVKYAEMYRRPSKKPTVRGNQRN